MGQEGVEARLASLCAEAEDAVLQGYNILIVSDRKVDAEDVAIPALARAVGDPPAPGRQGPAHPRRPGGRDRHRARSSSLRGAGGLRRRAVHPTSRSRPCSSSQAMPRPATNTSSTSSRASARGLMKVMSKMGISTYMSYTGAQIFGQWVSSRRWSTSTSPAPPARSKASVCSR